MVAPISDGINNKMEGGDNKVEDTMIYQVTKVEKTSKGYKVTAVDTDDTKMKHRNISEYVDDPTKFPVGSLCRVMLMPNG